MDKRIWYVNLMYTPTTAYFLYIIQEQVKVEKAEELSLTKAEKGGKESIIWIILYLTEPRSKSNRIESRSNRLIFSPHERPASSG